MSVVEVGVKRPGAGWAVAARRSGPAATRLRKHVREEFAPLLACRRRIVRCGGLRCYALTYQGCVAYLIVSKVIEAPWSLCVRVWGTDGPDLPRLLEPEVRVQSRSPAQQDLFGLLTYAVVDVRKLPDPGFWARASRSWFCSCCGS